MGSTAGRPAAGFLFFVFYVFLACLMAPAAGLAADGGAAPSAPAGQDEVLKAADLPKIIELLENEQERGRLLRLLKFMAAAGSAGVAPAGPPPAVGGGETARPGLAAFRPDMESFRLGLALSARQAAAILKTLFTPQALAIWPGYFLTLTLWALVCLTAAQILSRRYGRRPIMAEGGPPLSSSRLKRTALYLSALIFPNLVLIISLSLWPKPPAAAPGVTADMALGFVFLESLARHLFINFSALYIVLKTATALLTAGGPNRRTLIGLPETLAGPVLELWRFAAVYLAALLFIQEVFLDNFALDRVYAPLMTLFLLPGPAAFTFKMWRGLIVRPSGGSPEARPAGRYLLDGLIRRCWAPASLLGLWLAVLTYLVWPQVSLRFFIGRLAAALGILGLAAAAVLGARLLMEKFLKPDEDGDRRILNYLDCFTAAAAGLTAFALMASLWGAPLDRLLANDPLRDILGRSLVIALTVAGLIFFLKLSRLIAERLLNAPNLNSNRHWRTGGQLVLAGVRALAFFMALAVILERLGVKVGPILAGAGILGLGVGLGAQSLIKDFINGVSMLSMDIIAVGDFVTIGEHSGTVEAVGLRSLRLRDKYWNLIMIPNSGVGTIINKSRGQALGFLEVVMPPTADPDRILDLARTVAGEFNADPEWRGRLSAPVSVAGIVDFNAAGTVIRLQINAPAGEQLEPKRELRRRLKLKMLQAGF